MELTEIKTRIAEISERLGEISREQMTSGYELAKAQGADKMLGISIDPLTAWARRMRELNIEAQELIAERKSLRAVKRESRACACDCH
jgi:hypothetical protein